MNMTGEVELPASRETVWSKLNDAEVLRACIPGCESLEMTSATAFAAVARVKVGPVSARFKGNVELSDLDPPSSYRISGAGDGGVAGFAKGGAVVNLREAASGCVLVYSVDAAVGGKIAQLGGRLIDGVAKKMADQFFASFAATVRGDGVPDAATAQDPA